MLQTWWDTNQQALRKLIDVGAGALVSYGLIDESGAAVFVALAIALMNFGWWLFANRKAVTVAGLEAADKANAAHIVAGAIKAVKNAGK